MGQRSKTLKHKWKRFKFARAARRAMRARIALERPHEFEAYTRLRAAGMSDRQAIREMLAVNYRAWDRAIDAWIPFDDDAYHAELAALSPAPRR